MKDDDNDGIIKIEVSKEYRDSALSMDGNKKIFNYFISIVDNSLFQQSIDIIRKRFIDKNGKINDPKKFEKVKNILCRKWGLDELSWSEDVENYIIKNELPTENLSTPCIVFDRIEVGEDEYPNGYSKDPDDDWSEPNDPIELEPWSYSYPVIMRISPYASQREIIDYIKKSYNGLIKPIQDSYKLDINLGKVRRKNPNIQVRNKFIYENKDLPRSEIMKLVIKEFKEYLDVAHIGKIISLEKNRRESK